MKVDIVVAVIIVLVIVLVWFALVNQPEEKTRENLSGFGVTSALNFYDQGNVYCRPASGAFSGGCFTAGPVVI